MGTQRLRVATRGENGREGTKEKQDECWTYAPDGGEWRCMASRSMLTTNLGVRSSNLFGRAIT